MNKLNLIFFFLIVNSMFTNCASGELKVAKKSDSSFSKYSAIQIAVDDGGVTNGAALGNDIRTKVLGKLASKIKSEIFITDAPSDKKIKDFLKLTLKILAFKDVTKMDRQQVGALAGRANLSLDGEFIDTKTKSVLSKFNVEETSSGGSAFAGVTDDIVEAASEKIANFILENSK